MTFFDFVSGRLFPRVSSRLRAGLNLYERRPNGVCPADGRTAPIRIRQVRSPLRRRLSGALAPLLRTIPGPELRAIDLPRELARHRNLPARPGLQALSQWHSPAHRSQHLGRRERKARLAHLFRFRPRADRTSPFALRRGTVRRRVGASAPMPWTPRPSICVCRCSLGPSSASTRPLSNCTRF